MPVATGWIMQFFRAKFGFSINAGGDGVDYAIFSGKVWFSKFWEREKERGKGKGERGPGPWPWPSGLLVSMGPRKSKTMVFGSRGVPRPLFQALPVFALSLLRNNLGSP